MLKKVSSAVVHADYMKNKPLFCQIFGFFSATVFAFLGQNSSQFSFQEKQYFLVQKLRDFGLQSQ